MEIMLAPLVNPWGRAGAGCSISAYSDCISISFASSSFLSFCSPGRIWTCNAPATDSQGLQVAGLLHIPSLPLLCEAPFSDPYGPQHHHKFTLSIQEYREHLLSCQFKAFWKELCQFGVYIPYRSGGWESVLSSPSRNTLKWWGGVS